MYSEKIFTDSTLLVRSPNSKWSISESSQVAELKNIPFLIFPRSAGMFFRDRLINVCTQHGFYPKIKHESINAFSILKLVEKDIGISIMPKSILRGYSLNLDYLEIDDLNIPLDMMVSYRNDQNSELPVSTVQIIKEQVG